VAGTLLGGFALALDGVCQDLSRIRRTSVDTQYQRAVDLMAADARGIICINPTPNESGRYGRCLACFVSTHRVNAISDGLWSGAARVGYWLADGDNGSKLLWRSEASAGADRASETWTCLLDGIVDCEIELLSEDDWSSWPKSEDQMKQTDGRISFRLSVVAAGGPREDIRQLPIAVLRAMVNVPDDYHSFPQGSQL